MGNITSKIKGGLLRLYLAYCQAVKALITAYKIIRKDWLLEGAKAGADFIIHTEIRNKSYSDYGLTLACEDFSDKVTICGIAVYWAVWMV